jgi:hypothetical protein
LPQRQHRAPVRVHPERLAASSKFAGLGDEADPITANRAPVPGDAAESTDKFSVPQQNGIRRRICGLPSFVTVAGGAYCFLLGVRALRYLASSGANS